jgi:hypothetical protein
MLGARGIRAPGRDDPAHGRARVVVLISHLTSTVRLEADDRSRHSVAMSGSPAALQSDSTGAAQAASKSGAEWTQVRLVA